MPYDYYFGLDLGQSNDYTALAIIEEPVWIPPPPEFDRTAVWPLDKTGWTSISELLPSQVGHFRSLNYWRERPPTPPLYLRHLDRVRHVSYQVVVDQVAALLRTPPLARANVALVVDYGGVGHGVVDMLVVAGLRPIAVTIHGGGEVHSDPEAMELSVPKRELIIATQAALQSKRLRMTPGLAHTETLQKELLSYRVKIAATGHDTYNAREGEHDDLVLATSLATWYREWFNHHVDVAQARKQRGHSDLANGK